MTEYVLRVTIFVPEPMVSDANQLALCLGRSLADAQTFGTAVWQDGNGGLYSVASTKAKSSFPTAAGSSLVPPEFAPDVDLEAARRAQAALAIYDPATPVQADPSRILAIIHDDAQSALTLAGVVPVPVPGGT